MTHQWPIRAAVLVLLGSALAWSDTLQTQTVFYQELSWSPDGTKIAFSAMVNQKPAEVYVMVLRGKLVTKLTDNDVWDGWTCWSQDGARIYFSSNRDGNDEIYAMNADGGGVKRLTINTAKDAAPCISPNGIEIVFASDRDGNQEVYTMSVDGLTSKRLTNTPAKEYNPRWSPDGRHVVCYAEVKGEKDQIVVIDASTGDARRVASDTTHNTFAGWSPDGGAVIYCCSLANGEKWIYSCALDGSKNEKLLPLQAFYADYSPDGKRIAYVAGGWPSSNIYVIDYSDGTLRCLTCDLSLEPEVSEELSNRKSKPRR